MSKKSLAEQLSAGNWPLSGIRPEAFDALRKHTAMFDIVDRLNLDTPMQKVLGSVAALQKVTEQASAFQKGFAVPLALAQQHQQVARLAASMAPFAENSEALSGLFSFHKILAGDSFNFMKAIDRHALRPSPSVLREFEAIGRLQATIARTFGEGAPWASHLASIVAPSMSLLSDGLFARPAGVLSALGDLGASFAWLRLDNRDAPVLAASAFVRESLLDPIAPRHRRIEVRCDVRCSICEDPMLICDRNFHWESEEDLVIDLAVVPLCAACTRRAQEDPSYWRDQLARADAGPLQLELVQGDAEGDGEPTGVLRVAEKPDDADGD